VKDIEEKIRELIKDRKRIESVLLIEKARRGVSKRNLLFIGMANVADYYWCAMRAVLKSRSNEIEFFESYLNDRIHYSYHLGLTNRLPKRKEALLEIGNKITFGDIEKLLKERAKENHNFIVEVLGETRTNKNGNKIMILNLDIPLELKRQYEREAKAKGTRIADPEEFPKLRGELLQSTRAENYPTIRWNFEWGKYVVVGAPDGIADSFVYEFKTTTPIE
jgi:hypothetical protein